MATTELSIERQTQIETDADENAALIIRGFGLTPDAIRFAYMKGRADEVASNLDSLVKRFRSQAEAKQ